MSWLSGGISSLTDQLSTFTKEVIAESTQEIEDPVTELHLARKRIEEFQNNNAQSHEELKKCQEKIQEFQDRAETAELQVVNNNHEYRKLLQEKDGELKQLRKRFSEVQEQQKKLLFSSETNLSTVSSSGSMKESESTVNGGMFVQGGEFEWFGEGGSDDIDYDMSGFQSHSQINQLQSEIARLQVECQHWKDLARSKTQEINVTDSMGSSEQLQILQQSLEEERSRHEHELTTLQHLHAQQLETLSQRHTTAMDESQDTINNVVSLSGEKHLKEEEQMLVQRLKNSKLLLNELNSFISDVRGLLKSYQDNQCNHLETERMTLMSYLEEMQESLTGHQKKMADLQSQRASLEIETEQLNNQIEILQMELRDKDTELNEMRYCDEEDVPDRNTLRRSEVDRNNSLEDTSLEDILFKQKKGIIIKTDHEINEMVLTNEDLQKQVCRLKQEIEQKNNDILAKDIHHDKTCSNVVKELQMELEVMKQKNIMRNEEKLKEVNERRELLTELEKIKAENDGLKQNNVQRELDTQGDIVARLNESHKASLKELLIRKEAELKEENEKHVAAVKLELSREIEILNETLTEANAETERKKQELVELENMRKIIEGGQSCDNDHKLAETNQSLVNEIEKNQKELDRLRNHLLMVEEQHTNEQLQANDRESQLRIQLKIMEDKISKQDQRLTLSNLNSELSRVISEKNDLLSEMALLRERHVEDMSALQNLQTVLDDFQQGYSNSQDASLSLIKAQKNLEELQKNYQKVHEDKCNIQAALDEMINNNTSMVSLEEQLLQSKEECNKLATEVTAYKRALDKNKARIEQMSINEDTHVDRSLVGNLFLTYVSSQGKKKEEIAMLIGKILEISQDQLYQCMHSGSGWFTQLWSQDSKSPENQESFSQLFVSYLETESLPTKQQPPIILKNEESAVPSIPKHMQPNYITSE